MNSLMQVHPVMFPQQQEKRYEMHALYPFKYSDGGRSESRRPKQRNDCTVRALAIVTGQTVRRDL